jgi:hypothetical protein
VAAGDGVGAGHRLVGEQLVERWHPLGSREAQVETPPGVVQRRLGAAKDGIDPGAPPLPAHESLGLADRAAIHGRRPMTPTGVVARGRGR